MAHKIIMASLRGKKGIRRRRFTANV